MSHFIFMLTKDDRTVSNAVQVYSSLSRSPLRYVGFKDIGVPLDELKALARLIKADGRQVMLEVVSTSREAEMRSVEGALEIGVDCLLGGRHAEDATRLLKGSDIRYFPFAGHTVGHPTKLTGSIDDIVDDAVRLAALPGVHGLDLLAYRYAGDVEELTRRVVKAVSVPVIAAGSIDSAARVQAMRQAGAWAFTVGSAVFDGSFLDEPVPQQIDKILRFEGVVA